MKTVLEVVKEYHLELFDKEYRDICMNDSHSINIQILKDLYVRDFKVNLNTNKAIIYVFDIEKYDRREDK